ncbi:unnamed protein product, partial [Amoebophrya sp. A120]
GDTPPAENKTAVAQHEDLHAGREGLAVSSNGEQRCLEHRPGATTSHQDPQHCRLQQGNFLVGGSSSSSSSSCRVKPADVALPHVGQESRQVQLGMPIRCPQEHTTVVERESATSRAFGRVVPPGRACVGAPAAPVPPPLPSRAASSRFPIVAQDDPTFEEPMKGGTAVSALKINEPRFLLGAGSAVVCQGRIVQNQTGDHERGRTTTPAAATGGKINDTPLVAGIRRQLDVDRPPSSELPPRGLFPPHQKMVQQPFVMCPPHDPFALLRPQIASKLVPARELPDLFGFVLFWKERNKYTEFVLDTCKNYNRGGQEGQGPGQDLQERPSSTTGVAKCIHFHPRQCALDERMAESIEFRAMELQGSGLNKHEREEQLRKFKWDQYLAVLDVKYPEENGRGRPVPPEKAGTTKEFLNPTSAEVLDKNRTSDELQEVDQTMVGKFVKIWGRRQREKFSSFDSGGWLWYANRIVVDDDPMAFVYLDVSRFDHEKSAVSSSGKNSAKINKAGANINTGGGLMFIGDHDNNFDRNNNFATHVCSSTRTGAQHGGPRNRNHGTIKLQSSSCFGRIYSEGCRMIHAFLFTSCANMISLN